MEGPTKEGKLQKEHQVSEPFLVGRSISNKGKEDLL
jgi:hypothetical protein